MIVPISAHILTYNSERTIERALASLSFAEEIILIDSGSTDATLEIAKKHTDKIFYQSWKGYVAQTRYASSYCRYDWLFWLDSDEEVSTDLANEIKTTLAANQKEPLDKQLHAYVMQRRSFYLGRWILHGAWTPDKNIRLYHKKHADINGKEPHPKVKAISRKIGTLNHILYHDTYASISAQLQTIERYSTAAAEDYHVQGKRLHLSTLFFCPPWRFFRDYILKYGFLDGMAGLIIAINTSFYVFVKYAKVWEKQRLDPKHVKRNRQIHP